MYVGTSREDVVQVAIASPELIPVPKGVVSENGSLERDRPMGQSLMEMTVPHQRDPQDSTLFHICRHGAMLTLAS